MSFPPGGGLKSVGTKEAAKHPVVHLELHTGDAKGAVEFYTGLFGWRAEQIEIGPASYLGLDLAGEIEGGVVECGAGRPLWLPYVEVESVAEATDRARLLGAAVMLEPREGPAGWRSVLTAPNGAEVALWQPKSGR